MAPVAESFSRGKYPIIVLLVIPLIGGMMVVKAVIRQLASNKYGQIRFYFIQPGELGTTLNGYLEIPKGVSGEAELQIRLTNRSKEISQVGGKKRLAYHVLWKNEFSKRSHLYPGVKVPVSFDLPLDGNASNSFMSNPHYYWEVSFEIHQPGLDLLSEHRFPVLPSSSPSSSLTKASIFQGGVEKVALGNSSFVSIEQGVDGLEIDFKKTNRVASAGIPFVFSLFFFGFPFIFISKLYSTNNMTALYLTSPIYFLFFAAGMLLFFISVIFGFGRFKLCLREGELEHISSLFGIKFKKKIPYNQIYGVSVASTARVGDRSFYDLKLEVGKKMKMNLNAQIPDAHQLGQVAKLIEERLGPLISQSK